ncbi:MAG TPA: DoxX family protein, partial [Ramlibacter sp.]
MATTTATTTYHDPSNSSLWDTAALLGRIFMAYLFIPAGWGKIAGFTGVAGYIASKGLPMP